MVERSSGADPRSGHNGDRFSVARARPFHSSRRLPCPRQHQRLRFRVFTLGLVAAYAFASFEPSSVLADRSTSTPRFTLYIGSMSEKSSSGTSRSQVKNLAETSLTVLERSFEEMSRVFGRRPQRNITLKFLSSRDFARQTGAPEWTSAMYLDQEITIPVQAKRHMDAADLERALRHEYVHAVTAELTRDNCPAWLDEGLAQFIEGPANPILAPALRDWMRENETLPLSWLNDGFMSLDEAIVPVAYAQSLFAARTLVHRFGFPAVTKYLEHLGNKEADAEAFEKAFGLSKTTFERQLNSQIARWAKTDSEL